MGYGLMALGPVGLILPILPGAVFFGLGVFVLRDQHRWAGRFFAVFAHRWPKMATRIELMEEGTWDRARKIGAWRPFRRKSS